MYSTVISGALLGVNAYTVQVEVDVAQGLPAFSMVGFLGSEVREAKERVLAALKNAGLDIPPMHITVNLSPGDVRKEGTAFDLPVAVGLLEALGYFPRGQLAETLFLGELSLNGEIKRIRGVLPIVREGARLGIKECIVPWENAGEGALIPNIRVRGVRNISELLLFLQAGSENKDELLPVEEEETGWWNQKDNDTDNDFREVKGQEVAKRAAEIAAAGFHNLLMTGPPGAGKSMIAKKIPGIMPPLSKEESLEVTAIYSVAGVLNQKGLIVKRPFQSPHHSLSQVALTGGGTVPRPGLISLAHRGVLFLDELTEFQRSVLDTLRQPLEEHKIQIVRAGGNITYPSDFMLVGAMNPCPCGFYPDRNRCRCTEPQIKRYLSKISGPILDRMDLCVELQAVDLKELRKEKQGESSRTIRKRVQKARMIQQDRFRNSSYRFNAEIPPSDLDRYCKLGERQQETIDQIFEKLGLSVRSYHRILKVARTIADLEEQKEIGVNHILEAACFRPDSSYWI